MTHRSKKPFECKYEGCDKSYCDARSLRRHLENHHQQTTDPMLGGAMAAEANFFQFDPTYRQQILTANGDGRPFDPQKSPGYLAQVSPVTPTSPMPQGPRGVWPYNPLE